MLLKKHKLSSEDKAFCAQNAHSNVRVRNIRRRVSTAADASDNADIESDLQQAGEDLVKQWALQKVMKRISFASTVVSFGDYFFVRFHA